MIPRFELIRLEQSIADAEALAAVGNRVGGYLALDLRLLWAQTPPLDPVTWQRGALDPWSGELSHLYLAALQAYVSRYPEVLEVVAHLHEDEALAVLEALPPTSRPWY